VAEAAVHLECLPKVFNAQDGDGQFLKNAEVIQLPYEASAICRERRLQAIEDLGPMTAAERLCSTTSAVRRSPGRDHQAARRPRPEA
jgi:hypothetical protein